MRVASVDVVQYRVFGLTASSRIWSWADDNVNSILNSRVYLIYTEREHKVNDVTWGECIKKRKSNELLCYVKSTEIKSQEA